MSSKSAESIRDLAPGTVITFGDLTEFPSFEDALATEIVPYMPLDHVQWENRYSISDLIRPPKFNGRIGNVALTVVDSPEERLLNAPGGELTYRWVAVGRAAVQGEYWGEVRKSLLGFELDASAFSSGRGEVGRVRAGLFYYPDPKVYRQNVRRLSGPNTGRFGKWCPLKRAVSKPRIVEGEKSFTELADASSQIAYSVLEEQLKKARPQPFRN